MTRSESEAVEGATPAGAPPVATPPRAKHLVAPRPPIAAAAVPELVPARMVNEVLYCERLMYLEWVQGEFADSADTVEGRVVHRRADRPGKPLGGGKRDRASTEGGGESTKAAGSAAAEGGAAAAAEERPYSARSVWLSSEKLGATAKIDVVEAEGGQVVAVEYKRGKQPDLPERAYLPERAQLCLQVLLLRAHGFHCEQADIYFAGDRRRVRIDIDEPLIDTTLRAIGRARELAAQATMPPPLVDSPKCNGCSLVGICLPDEVGYLRALEQAEADVPPGRQAPAATTGEAPEPDGLRRLWPARDDRLPLYVQEHGARVGLSGERLRVACRQGPPVEARIANTSQVCLLGNVQITAQALRRLMSEGVAVTFFSFGGWFLGRVVGLRANNVELRVAQYRWAAERERCLRLARGLVVSKILNSRTLLRRNHRDGDAVALGELRQLARKASAADSLGQLLGLEGTAARSYFGAFSGMLKPAARLGGFGLQGRNRRPPRDPINALLSFCYALLTKDFTITLGAVGLDPMLGFYHQPRFSRPALALDLMEEFRPLVADSVVIGAVNNDIIGERDFIRSATAVSLTAPARRRLIQAYERRMDQLVTHPLFGYRLSYRRVLEVQARLLGRCLLGEIDEYPAFRTR